MLAAQRFTWRAANAGHARCVQLLLTAGVDVDATTMKGHIPLALACFWKHSECARLLVLAGANLHAPAMGTLLCASTMIQLELV
mmetsp:Transcript_6816/g.14029  ORF Transcript_6816/g.14029 Transcript_6816/m.14029 type:complete len:84 (-) Transcript_6816:162-413(-)